MEILLKFFHHIQILILPVHVHVFQCASAAKLLHIEKNIYNSQKSLKVKLQIKTNYTFHAQLSFATNIILLKWGGGGG